MKLKFHFDAFYNGELYARIGEVKEVPEANGFALRWIRRGAEQVSDSTPEQVPAPVVPARKLSKKEEKKAKKSGIPEISEVKTTSTEKDDFQVVEGDVVVVPLNEENNSGNDVL